MTSPPWYADGDRHYAHPADQLDGKTHFWASSDLEADVDTLLAPIAQSGVEILSC